MIIFLLSHQPVSIRKSCSAQMIHSRPQINKRSPHVKKPKTQQVRRRADHITQAMPRASSAGESKKQCTDVKETLQSIGQEKYDVREIKNNQQEEKNAKVDNAPDVLQSLFQNYESDESIVGAHHVAGTYAAALYYQMTYRVQNHSFNLSLPQDTDEAVYLEIDARSGSSCIHVPKQLPKDELIKILPESWMFTDTLTYARVLNVELIATQPQYSSLRENGSEDSDNESMSLNILMADPPTNAPTVEDEDTHEPGQASHEGHVASRDLGNHQGRRAGGVLCNQIRPHQQRQMFIKYSSREIIVFTCESWGTRW
ncbi:hypothetical protein KSP40_PGU008831 [Platanthera guangdongensis]|uniref:Uncharacterized protein n=1 Tax=Platanthera guangdongensis TaxID=2320717 RepID=A0ABR2N2Q2_9ASPA